MAEFNYQGIQPPTRGMHTAAAPDQIGQEFASDMLNFLVDQPGKIRLRGYLRTVTANMASPTAYVLSAWASNNVVLIGVRDTLGAGGSTQNYTPQLAAQSNVGAFSQYVLPKTSGYTLTPTDGALTAIAYTDVARVPGIRSARVQNYVYGNGLAALLADGSITIADRIIPNTKFLRWNGTATQPIVIQGPRGGLDTRAYLQRLFVLGGARADGTTSLPNPSTSILYYSDQLQQDGTFPTDTVDNWKDNVSGLYNYIDIGSEDAHDPGVGLARVGQSLVIFKRKSIWMMFGNTPESFSVRKIIEGVGCIDSRSIVEVEDAVIFTSDTGIYRFDGVSVTELSRNIRNTVQSALYRALMMGYSGFVNAAMVDPSNLMVTIGIIDDFEIVLFSAYYNMERDAWVRFTSPTFNTATNYSAYQAPRLLVSTRDGLFGITNQRVARLTDAFQTEQTLYSKGRDYLDGLATAFTASFRSKLYRLGGPVLRSQVHRVIADYLFTEGSGSVDTQNYTDTYKFELVSGRDHSVVLASDALIPHNSSESSRVQQRKVTDVFDETDDFQYKLTYSGLYVSNSGGLPQVQSISGNNLEWHGAVVEYATSRQTRNA